MQLKGMRKDVHNSLLLREIHSKTTARQCLHQNTKRRKTDNIQGWDVCGETDAPTIPLDLI